jgi:anti-sigma factor RsiW
MMTRNQTEREEIEALLPWHAAGTLSRRDAQRVEAALEEDRDLARQFELVREELSETIHLNETLGAPSARAMEKLFAGIEAEGATRRRRRSFDLAAFIGERLTLFSPRTLAWSATAAVLAIVLQAGLLAGLYLGEGSESPGTFRTASAPTRSFAPAGSYALIGFTPQASAADVTKFLEAHKAAIVDGPKPGGLYRIRIAQAALPKNDLAAIVKQMQDESKIVRFVAATE